MLGQGTMASRVAQDLATALQTGTMIAPRNTVTEVRDDPLRSPAQIVRLSNRIAMASEIPFLEIPLGGQEPF
jgi:hypothetical protein